MAKCKYDWVAIRAYFDAGHSVTECGRRFGFHIDAWYKAMARGVLPQTQRQNRGQRLRYDRAAIQRYYDEGHSYRECRIRFGFHAKAWEGAVRRGAIVSREQRWPIELENRCALCGLVEWLGKPLSVQIDHINGNNKDNRLKKQSRIV